MAFFISITYDITYTVVVFLLISSCFEVSRLFYPETAAREYPVSLSFTLVVKPKETTNKIKANEVLAAANNLIGTDEPETMRNNLRAMMDCFFLYGAVDNKDSHNFTFKELDKLLRSLDELAENHLTELRP